MSQVQPAAPRVSVALCTYNGGAYIGEQLASILAQTRAVDEIVISDDGSSDNTLQCVQDALVDSGIAWRLLPGARLGITQNFARAVQACHGDVIFLCDQDDVWLPHKTATLLALLDSEPRAQLVFSDARLVGATLEPLGRNQFQMVRMGARHHAALAGPGAFTRLLKRNVVTGATVAFRRSLLDAALPFVDGWLHDEWLAVIAAAQGPLVAAREPLVLYRQHGRNQCGMTVEPLATQLIHAAGRQRQATGVKRILALQARLQQSAALNIRWADHLDAALQFETRRATLAASRAARVWALVTLTLAGRYHRHADGWRSLVKDLLAA